MKTINLLAEMVNTVNSYRTATMFDLALGDKADEYLDMSQAKLEQEGFSIDMNGNWVEDE